MKTNHYFEFEVLTVLDAETTVVLSMLFATVVAISTCGK
jgi:hypothetical protein